MISDDLDDAAITAAIERAKAVEQDTLKYRLLGPSLTKAGQDSVDQQKVLLRHLVWDDS